MALVVRPVHFRNQRFQHWRPRRHLGDLYARAEWGPQLHQLGSKPACDFVALRLAIVAGRKVDLNIGLIRLMSQEIVADQAIKVVGTRCSRVDLIVGDFRLLLKIVSQCLCNSGGLFEGRSVGHINHDLEFALVIEGKHFHAHPLQRDEGNCR